MLRFKKIVILFCWIHLSLFSQTIDNTASYRCMSSGSYFRFHYENDVFTATDYYYTQGINFELAAPSFRRNPLTVLLPKLKGSCATYGLALEHVVYTPTSIRNSEISYNDRPFAAYIMLKTFLVSTDTLHHQRLSTTVSTGVMGTAAFGEDMQKTIHKWLNNKEPLGWEHQVKNDVVLNYELSYERQLYSYKNSFLFSSLIKIQAGTLMDNAQVGCTVIAGKFISPFSSSKSDCASESENKLKLYCYAQPLARLVGYNATLQGGLFNRDSPYTIASQQVTRTVFQTNFGLALSFNKIYLEYCQSFSTREFDTGKTHRWGGIKIGVRF